MTDHDTLEDRLARSLDRQAGGLTDAPLTLDAVRGRAHGIRRRRRALVAGTAAAVVLAVAIPLGLAGGGHDDSGIDPAPRPELPRATVLHDGVLTLPDGSTVAVPYDDVTELARLSDGRIVVMRQRQAVVLDAAGVETASYPVLINDLTAAAEDRAAGWVGADQHVMVLEAGSAEPTALGRAPASAITIEAVLNDRCAEDLCHVLLGDGTAVTHDVDLRGTARATLDGVGRIGDVTAGGDAYAVDLTRAGDEQFGCAAIYRPAEAEVTARTCDTSGLRFSPDEQHLLGMRGDNNMAGDLTVVDAGLQPVLAWEPDGGRAISSAAWADATHLEVSVVDPDTSQWSLLRVGLDGTSEVLEGPQTGPNPEISAAYLFAE